MVHYPRDRLLLAYHICKSFTSGQSNRKIMFAKKKKPWISCLFVFVDVGGGYWSNFLYMSSNRFSNACINLNSTDKCNYTRFHRRYCAYRSCGSLTWAETPFNWFQWLHFFLWKSNLQNLIFLWTEEIVLFYMPGETVLEKNVA